MNQYKKQNAALESLFGVLPQITLYVIILIRFIVFIPLFMYEKSNFGFFNNETLETIMALIVVLAIEVVGLTASLLTAYFRKIRLSTGFYFALGIAVFSWGFTSFLLANIDNFEIGQTTRIVLHVFNALGFVLGEANGFLVLSFIPETEETEPETIQNTNEIAETSPTDLNTAIAEMRAGGATYREIATTLNTNITHVSRVLKNA